MGSVELEVLVTIIEGGKRSSAEHRRVRMEQVTILPGDGKQGRREFLLAVGAASRAEVTVLTRCGDSVLFVHLQCFCAIKYELHLTHCLQEIISL